MDSLIKFLKDRIIDTMSLEEIVDAFEQMCLKLRQSGNSQMMMKNITKSM